MWKSLENQDVTVIHKNEGIACLDRCDILWLLWK